MRKALKFTAGAALGVFLWLFASAGYNAILAAFSEPLLHIDPRLRGAEVISNGHRIIARGGDVDPTVPGVVIPADQLTYNVVLLLGLFATIESGFRDRGFLRLAIALAILFATHVLAVVVSLELTFATRTGAWGAARYSPLAQDFWTAVEYGYRLFGMFGIAFGLWWTMGKDEG
ncbi:MAG: hypothetical protein ACXW2P_01765 [Thermoanaerobaculia bacterium]